MHIRIRFISHSTPHSELTESNNYGFSILREIEISLQREVKEQKKGKWVF